MSANQESARFKCETLYWDGATLRFYGGRSGYILYNDQDRSARIYYEAALHGVTLSIPTELTSLPESERLEILADLRVWLSERRVTTGLEALLGVEDDESTKCAVASCASQALRGYAICRRHYDLGCIGRMI